MMLVASDLDPAIWGAGASISLAAATLIPLYLGAPRSDLLDAAAMPALPLADLSAAQFVYRRLRVHRPRPFSEDTLQLRPQRRERYEWMGPPRWGPLARCRAAVAPPLDSGRGT